MTDFPVFPILEEMMEACQYVAPFNPDYNGEKQSGCVYYQSNTRKGQRCSTAKAFLRSVSDRKNLHISAMSHVHKISIDAKTKEARGVLYRKNGKLLHIAAIKEIILSAGAVSSPQVVNTQYLLTRLPKIISPTNLVIYYFKYFRYYCYQEFDRLMN